MFAVNVSDQVATILMRSTPVNALSEAWLTEFLRTIDGLAVRHDWKVLHLRSDQKAFCAGADLKEAGRRSAAVSSWRCPAICGSRRPRPRSVCRRSSSDSFPAPEARSG
jgi:enoyl-CoA hydratase/carnithine racemase